MTIAMNQCGLLHAPPNRLTIALVNDTTTFKPCSTCKKPIALGAIYFQCSVSTCQGQRTGFAFCSVDCWDAHVPTMRHREAWAEERLAPTAVEAQAEDEPRKIIMPSARHGAEVQHDRGKQDNDDEVLVVVSKLKAYIREQSQMNTSADVMDILSQKLRRLCDQAIVHARSEGRKTVMARDFE
jgi:histone H3/H4